MDGVTSRGPVALSAHHRPRPAQLHFESFSVRGCLTNLCVSGGVLCHAAVLLRNLDCRRQYLPF